MNDASEPVPQSLRSTDKALEDLRAEFVVLRRGVEDWQKHIEKNLPPDYTKFFDVLGGGVQEGIDKAQALTEKIDTIQAVPRKAMDTVVEEGRKMFDELRTKITFIATHAQRERDDLKHLIGLAQTKKQQQVRLLWAGGGGAVAGIFLFFVLAFFAPFGLDGRIAAAIMGQDRWNAGQTLMHAGNPNGWRLMVQDANLTSANRAKVDACRAAAAKSKKDENCTISVSPQSN